MAALPNRNAVEVAFAKNISSAFADYRQRLANLTQSGQVPTDQFWLDIEEDFRKKLAAILLLIMIESGVKHGATRDSIVAFSTEFARRRAFEVGGRFAANSRIDFGNGTDPAQVFGDDRAEAIAITETTVATSAGGERAAVITGKQSVLDIWYTAADDRVCKICGPLHKKNRDVWELQFPGGPPAHPNCRCYISYEFERKQEN